MLKKLSIGGYVLAFATIMTLASFIVAIISNGYSGYDMGNFSTTVLLSIAAIILGVASIGLPLVLGDKKIYSVLQVLMIIVLSFLIWSMVYGKMDVFGTVLFSDLEKGYPPAEAANLTGIIAIVMYLVSALLTMVANFFPVLKKA
ncbi:MAG: hypothetical protein J6D37_07485 [Clostridia bacterium]|nr:hypothetical protein [Clostridia bacterium]